MTVWFLLVAPVLPAQRQLGERDTARLFYPVERTVAEALRAGRLPFWDPHIESGTSLLGQVTPAALHPFALLYAALPFGLAFKLHHLLALLLGGSGAALLAARLGASRWPALLAGIVFGGSGALVSSASGALPYALGPAAAPLAIAGVLWFVAAPSPGRLLASSFALSLCAYGGDPQSLGMAILVAGILAILEPPRARRVAYVLAWAGCALLLCAPAAFPAISQFGRSERKGGITEAERKMFYTPPLRLLGLAIPLAFDGTEVERETTGDPYSAFVARREAAPFLNSICIGAPALLLAAWGFRRPRAAALLAMAALLIAASTGPAWHVQPVLERIIPGWSLFRYTEKFLLHVSWMIAVLAALGVEETLLGPPRKARRIAWLAVGLGSAVFAFFLVCVAAEQPALDWLSQRGHDPTPQVARRFLESVRMGTARAAALSGVIAGIAWLRLLRRETNLPAILTAAAAAASALIAPPLRTVRADLYEEMSSTGRKLLEIGGREAGKWRVWSDANKLLPLPDQRGLNADEARLVGFREAVWPQLQALDGLDGAAPYFSAVDPDYSMILREGTDAALDVLGIRFYVLQPWAEMPARAVRSESGFGILQRKPSPRAFVVHRTRSAATREEALSAVSSIDVFQEAVVSADGPRLLDAPAPGAAVELRRQVPERIEASVRADRPGLLVVSEHYDPGWHAEVDGRETTVHRTDMVVLGVPIPAGEHEVRLWFRPRGFLPGLACAATAALVLAILALRRQLALRARSHSPLSAGPEGSAPPGAACASADGDG